MLQNAIQYERTDDAKTHAGIEFDIWMHLASSGEAQKADEAEETNVKRTDIRDGGGTSSASVKPHGGNGLGKKQTTATRIPEPSLRDVHRISSTLTIWRPKMSVT